LAAESVVTGIGCTWVGIITVHGGTDTGSLEAVVCVTVGGTSVIIITRRSVECHGTSSRWVATIIGTLIAVVTSHEACVRAGSICASIVFGTSISIITGQNVSSIHTTRCGVTSVVSTDILIITIGGCRTHAESLCTCIVFTTCVPIVTSNGVVGEYASTLYSWVAGIVGADIAIVTNLSFRTCALAVRTNVGNGAGVAIITLENVGHIGAACLRVAAVIGAVFSIGAISHATSGTSTFQANVIAGAGISIVACNCIVLIDTSYSRVTGIIGADISVVTNSHSGAGTDTVRTNILCGTSVSIVTSFSIGRVDTALYLVAGVIRTWVRIVTNKVRSGNTSSLGTHIGICTSVSIITGSVISNSCVVTLTCVGVTHTVFCTGVFIVFTDNQCSRASSLRTNIIGCTSIAIVASSFNRSIYALAFLITAIIRTRIAIVTGDLFAAGASATIVSTDLAFARRSATGSFITAFAICATSIATSLKFAVFSASRARSVRAGFPFSAVPIGLTSSRTLFRSTGFRTRRYCNSSTIGGFATHK